MHKFASKTLGYGVNGVCIRYGHAYVGVIKFAHATAGKSPGLPHAVFANCVRSENKIRNMIFYKKNTI